MKRNEIPALLLAAGITLAFTLTWLGFTQAGADSGEEAVPPLNPTPKMTGDGWELTIQPDKTTYESGEKPELILEAVNTTDQAQEIPLRFMLSAAQPGSALSRVLVVPDTLWTDECILTLAPGERKNVRKKPDLALPAQKEITVTLSSGKWLALTHPLPMKPSPLLAVIEHGNAGQEKEVSEAKRVSRKKAVTLP